MEQSEGSDTPKSDIFGELLSLLGQDTFLVLVEKFGGCTVYIQQFKDAKNEVWAAIGQDAYGKLVERFGGGRIFVPSARKWRARLMWENRKPYAYIARKLGVSEVTVWRYLSDMGLTNTETLTRKRAARKASNRRRRMVVQKSLGSNPRQ